MEASVGDKLVVESNRVGVPRKTGTVTEVLGREGAHHYRVQWEVGGESIFFPSSDASVEHAKKEHTKKT